MNSVLLLEDDPLFAETIIDVLEENHFDVTHSASGEKALELCYDQRFGLFLLDVRLPDLNGFDFLSILRDSGDITPAIFLTSLTEQSSLSKGFQVGCDDYLKKPVNLEELLLRIRALLKRSGISSETLTFPGGSLDITTNTLTTTTGVSVLPRQEKELLQLFLQEKGRVITKEQIFETIWMGESHEQALRVYIAHLRELLGKSTIRNIRGVGYLFHSNRDLV